MTVEKPDANIARLVHRFLDQVEIIRPRLFADPPEAASPAMDEQAHESPLHHPGWGTDRPVWNAHQSISPQVTGAIDHMRALAHLIAIEPAVTYPLSTTARAVFEHLGQARWLLDGWGAPERVRRWALLRNHTDQWELKGWETAEDDDPQVRARKKLLRRRIDERRGAIIQLRLNIDPTRPSGPRLSGAAPGFAEFAALAIDAEKAEIGAFWYARLSAVAHGVTWGLMSHLRWDEDETPESGLVNTNLGHDTTDIALLVAGTATALGEVLSQLDMLFGRKTCDDIRPTTQALRLAVRPYLEPRTVV